MLSVSFSAGFSAVAGGLPERPKAHDYWACQIFLSLPVSLTARIEIKTAEAVIAMKCRDERNRYHCLNGRELS